MEKTNHQIASVSNIIKSEKAIQPDLVEENYTVDLEEILGDEIHFSKPETIDAETGKTIKTYRGWMTPSHYQSREEKGELPLEWKQAKNIANTAKQIVQNFGRKEGYKMVADGEDYRISLESDGYLQVHSHDDKKILSVSRNSIDYHFNDKDVDKFQEYFHNLSQQQNQEMEH